MRKATIAILTVIFISFSIGFYLYPQMPNRMAGYWDRKGNADGYAPKFWGLFFTAIYTIVYFYFIYKKQYADYQKEKI